MNWASKKVLLVGMARSGIAAAELVQSLGAQAILNDAKPIEAFDGMLDTLRHNGAMLRLNEDPVLLLDMADAVVISPGVPIDSAIVKQAKKRGIPLLGELELAAMADKSRMVAVTGTNGKTTTVTLLGEIFKNAGKIARVAGNIGYPYSRTAMVAKADDITVVEVSSFQLESIESFHPKVAAVLNITEDHLNRHGTMEKYAMLKQGIFKNQTKEDVAVLNLDDPYTQRMAKDLNAQVMWFSRQKPVQAGAYVENGKIVCIYKGEKVSVLETSDLSIPGPHNLENALAATCVAVAMGVPSPVVRHTLRTFQGVEHRIEFVRTLNGMTYINDSKGTNVDSTIKAVQTMQEKTVILLGGYDKHTDFAPLADAMLDNEKMVGAVVLGETARQIKQTLKAKGFVNVVSALSLEDAVDKGRSLLDGMGNILLSPACASFDMFADYEERGRVFKNIVNRLS